MNSEQVRARMSACVISNNNICSQDMSWNFRGRAGSSLDSTMNTSLEIASVYCQVVRESSAHRQYGRGLFSLAPQDASNLITATCEFTVPSRPPLLSLSIPQLYLSPPQLNTQLIVFITAVHLITAAPVNCHLKSKKRYLHNRWNYIRAAVFMLSLPECCVL